MRRIAPWLLVLLSLPAFSADVAISGLPAADALGGTETTPVVQGGVTKKATAAQVSTYVRSQVTKSDVGLGNVDNTSNATERAATATLTNKTMSGAANTFANIALASLSLGDAVTWTGVHTHSAAEVRRILVETDQGTDLKNWDWDLQAGVHCLRTRTDADGAGEDAFCVTRGTTTTISNVALGNATSNPTGSWLGTGRFSFSGPVTVTGTSTGSGSALIISSTAPSLTWDDQDAGTNNRRWNARATGTSLIFEAINNADAGQKQFFNIARASNSSDISNIIYGNSTDLPTHTFRGEIIAGIAGRGVAVKEGSNARMGTATLVAGAATVSNTSVTANTRIFAFSQTDGGTPGWLRVSAKTAGTSFVITSSSASDTSTVAWLLVEPAP